MHEEFDRRNKVRAEELKSYRQLIKQLPASELKEYGAYGYLIIFEFPSEENDNTWQYKLGVDTNCGDGIPIGDRCDSALTKKAILKDLDFAISELQ